MCTNVARFILSVKAILKIMGDFFIHLVHLVSSAIWHGSVPRNLLDPDILGRCCQARQFSPLLENGGDDTLWLSIKNWF